MNDKVSEFAKFISEDPLMLGLCATIVVLVFVFIFVLFLGGKKKKSMQETEEKLGNTAQFLSNDLGEEPLKSTQEFNLASISEPAKEEIIEPINNDLTEPVAQDTAVEVAPISLGEVSVDTPLEMGTLEIPVEVSTEPVELEIPALKANYEEPVLKEEKTEELELPTMKIDTVKPKLEGTQPFSSVYLGNNDEMPKINDDEFSKTAIIRHIPKLEEDAIVEMPELKVEENVSSSDDIDLPKLNKDDSNSVLQSLTGESFNIK